jgi:hypothetical protein
MFNEYYVNIKALKDLGTIEKDILEKAHVMFKEVHKTIFDKIGNPKDKKSYRFIHY